MGILVKDLEDLLKNTKGLASFLKGNTKQKIFRKLLHHGSYESQNDLAKDIKIDPSRITQIMKEWNNDFSDLGWFQQTEEDSDKVHPKKSIGLTPKGIEWGNLLMDTLKTNKNFLNEFESEYKPMSKRAKPKTKGTKPIMPEEEKYQLIKEWRDNLPEIANYNCYRERPSKYKQGVPYDPNQPLSFEDHIPTGFEDCFELFKTFKNKVNDFHTKREDLYLKISSKVIKSCKRRESLKGHVMLDDKISEAEILMPPNIKSITRFFYYLICLIQDGKETEFEKQMEEIKIEEKQISRKGKNLVLVSYETYDFYEVEDANGIVSALEKYLKSLSKKVKKGLYKEEGKEIIKIIEELKNIINKLRVCLNKYLGLK